MHIPVLKKEIVDCFSYLKKSDGYFFDGTLGAGGHSLAIAARYKIQDTGYKFVGADKDQAAIDLAASNIKKEGLYDKFTLVNDDFKNIDSILEDLNIDTISGALLDLGVSSMQLDDSARGFSFKDRDAVLDMRMDTSQKLDAEKIINVYPQKDLEKILFNYGEEKYSRMISVAICKARKEGEIKTVGQLLDILDKVLPASYKYKSGKHFATKTFQAIRIEVNNELSGLDKAIKNIVGHLESKGRLAIITFHSLEDRIVKNTFRELSKECVCPDNAIVCTCGHKSEVKLITKKPVIPTEEEIKENSRSRSAKLRIVEKL